MLRLAVAMLGATSLAPAQGVADAAPVISQAAQLLNLPADQAARALPVRLRGVVVGEAQPVGKAFVLWDESEFIYVRAPENGPNPFQRGDLVEVEGTSGAGGFAPLLYMSAGRKIGTGRLPAPRALTFEQLIAGQFDAQWVRVRGVVRRCEPSEGAWSGRWRLALSTGGQLLTVHVNSELSPAEMVDAEVSVDGLYFNQHNVSRQFVRALVFVPHDVPVVIEAPAPENPFAAPVRPVGGLLQFERQGRYGHRVHVKGQVLHQAAEGWLWIRDGAHGLRIAARLTEPLAPGDSVDVLGFPTQGGYTPRMDDAVFRKNSSGDAPLPALPADGRAAISHDSDLIAIEAVLVETRRTADGAVVLLDWQGNRVSAFLPGRVEEKISAGWTPGSAVRATGICTVAATEAGPPSGMWEPRAFELLLRSPADLRVLRPAPWWTPQRILRALGGLAGGLLLVVAAVVLAARRRLREQEIQRAKAEGEFSAILAERHRLAREIHDTLAQDLAAVSMQLELAKATGETDRAALGRHLETAHRLVRDSLAEARSSIWNMRSQVLEKQDLPEAIAGVLRQLAADTPVQTEFTVTGQRRPLPPVVETALLRIAHEAITNAINHAAPPRLEVGLNYSGQQITLTVNDDGAGFETSQPAASAGHFGLAGMRERAAELGAQLTLASAPGRGTRLTISVPTPG